MTMRVSMKEKKQQQPSHNLSMKAIVYMTLLALQFGIQPIVTKQFMSKSVIKSTVILTQEIFKLLIGIAGIYLGQASTTTKTTHLSSAITLSSWVRLSLLPATLYYIQNVCSLMAYQNLDPLTYNVLNQTKTLSAAFCCYLLMKKKQSTYQILALVLLLLSALVMEKILSIDTIQMMLHRLPSYYWTKQQQLGSDEATTNSEDNNTPIIVSMPSSEQRLYRGVLPIIIASFLSGLAGAITQISLQTRNCNALLYTIELCIATIGIILVSFIFTNDGGLIYQHGYFHGWTICTLIPILTNSAGGIIVGLVIKYAGNVQKGFALIFGIAFTGIVQSCSSYYQYHQHGHDSDERKIIMPQQGMSKESIIGTVLAVISLWIHTVNPYMEDQKSINCTATKTSSDTSSSKGVQLSSKRRKSRKEE
jgi:UDP-sugar transporter A1/2/3